MKKLLTTITLSVLVGTTANSLQPIFAEKIVNTGFKSNQLNNKNISIKNQNDANPFINKIPTIDDNSNISSNVISSNGTIYLGTYQKGLWKSTDGKNFSKTSFSGKYTSSITIDSSGNVYVDNLGALFKSKDGITFEQVTGLPNDVSAISYFNNTIYVGMENKGLWKSTDMNYIWTSNWITKW